MKRTGLGRKPGGARRSVFSWRGKRLAGSSAMVPFQWHEKCSWCRLLSRTRHFYMSERWKAHWDRVYNIWTPKYIQRSWRSIPFAGVYFFSKTKKFPMSSILYTRKEYALVNPFPLNTIHSDHAAHRVPFIPALDRRIHLAPIQQRQPMEVLQHGAAADGKQNAGHCVWPSD